MESYLLFIGGFLLWSTTLVGIVMWLNLKFSELVPIVKYEIRTREFEERLRKLEMWASTKSFYGSQEKESQ